MLRTVVCGVGVAVVAGMLAIFGGTFGITTIWPVLLAVAIGLAAGPAIASRTGGAAIGAVVGFLAYAVMIGVLPATTGATALAMIGAVLVLTAVAALSAGLLPLWAGLAGFAAFAALYDPVSVASPTTFLTDASLALVTVLLALGLGALTALGTTLLGATTSARSDVEHLGAGEVA